MTTIQKAESMKTAHSAAHDGPLGIQEMNYKNPPIVEAVVQISFEKAIGVTDVDRVADRLLKSYASRSDRQTMTASLDTASGKLISSIQKVGVELRDDFATKVLIIDTSFLLLSALAPYGGWDALESRLMDEIERFRKIVGPLKLSRLGMRFVNRIDAPVANGAPDYGRYVRAQPTHLALPDVPMSGFLVQISQPLHLEGGSYTLSCGSVESPLLGYFGISVDIDVSVTKSMTLHLQKILDILREMRNQKNYLFESIITEEARSMFGVVK